MYQVLLYRLYTLGIKAIIFDKDNTLTPPYSFTMENRIENTVRQCQKLFGYDKVVIFSNSAGMIITLY